MQSAELFQPRILPPLTYKHTHTDQHNLDDPPPRTPQPPQVWLKWAFDTDGRPKPINPPHAS